MAMKRHLKKASAFRGGIVAAAAVLLCLGAVPAQAMVMNVDIGWGYYATADMTEADLIADYALQEGSIVQIIMYDSTQYPSTAYQSGEAFDNFDVFGGYSGAPIPGEPNTAPWNEAPTDANIYSPDTVPDGHLIAYTTEIGPAAGANLNGYNWYNIYASFTILDNYDSIYIRVFGATEFPLMTVTASYWGISDLGGGTPSLDVWYTSFYDVTATNNVNYFEVIPEPGTLALFALGGCGLWAGRRRLKRA